MAEYDSDKDQRDTIVVEDKKEKTQIHAKTTEDGYIDLEELRLELEDNGAEDVDTVVEITKHYNKIRKLAKGSDLPFIMMLELSGHVSFLESNIHPLSTALHLRNSAAEVLKEGIGAVIQEMQSEGQDPTDDERVEEVRDILGDGFNEYMVSSKGDFQA